MTTFPRQLLAPLLVTVLVLLAHGARPSAAAPDRTVAVGVVAPRAQLGQGADISAPLSQSLISALNEANAQVVPLESTGEQQVATEAAQKNCAYVLYTRVGQTHGRGGGSLLHKMTALKSQWPGGSNGSSGVQDAGQGADRLAAAEQAAVKAGDTISLEYRLLRLGSLTPAASGKLEGKAQADGEDVLSPLIAQLSGTVTSVTNGADEQRGVAQPPPEDASGGNRRGRSNRSGTANTAPPPAMNCEQMAANSHGTVSVEACNKMMGAQQAYNAALSDPSALRPGDDKMACEQIIAEMKQQQFAAPDSAKVAEAQASTADLQKTIAEQQKEAAERAAAQNAALLATTLTGGGITGTTERLAEKFAEENQAASERAAKETAPKAERTTSAAGTFAADAGQQLTANPRLARLVQLASEKRCKGK